MKRRSNCPVNCAVEIIGDKWTLLVLRDMLVYKKRNYKQFMQSEERISTNILATRLKMLVDEGLATKETDPNNLLKFIYQPTQKAKDMFPVILAMAQWSNKHLAYANVMPTERLNALRKEYGV